LQHVSHPDVERAVRAAVEAHGGHMLVAPQPATWLATFPTARAGAACAHRLHRDVAGDVRPGVALRAEDLPLSEEVRRALQLVHAVPPGETWAAAGAAAGLIHTLDGDVEELDRDHGRDADGSTRVFRVTAPPFDGLSGPPPIRTDLRPTLAVIPFGTYASDPEPVRLGDVIADQVISSLSKSHAINVISRLSTLAFRDRDSSISRIASSLAADFVVSGRYLSEAGKVRVHVELAEGVGSRVLWSEAFHDSETAALQADSQLVQALVGGVMRAVLASELRLLRTVPLPNLASHTLLLAAISMLYRLSLRDFDLAHRALRTVHERAPHHAAPLAWLARWHLFRIVQGWSDDRDVDGRLALDYAQRCLDLDPDSALGLTMLGNAHTVYLRDPDRALGLFDQALELDPNESLAWLQKGNARSFLGDGAAALDLAQKAVRLSPLDPARHYYLNILAGAALTAQSYDRAIDAARESLRLNRGHVSTHRVLAIALSMTGRLEEARASVDEVLRIEPGLTVTAYVARSPGERSGLAQTFGNALRAAGLPPGSEPAEHQQGG
jgi:TolB-like protein